MPSTDNALVEYILMTAEFEIWIRNDSHQYGFIIRNTQTTKITIIYCRYFLTFPNPYSSYFRLKLFGLH